MKDFLQSLRFKILIAILIVLAAFMVTAVYNGGAAPLTAKVIGFVTVPLQRGATAISGGVSDFFNKFLNAGKIYEENLLLQQEVNDLQRKLTDYNNAKHENEQFREILGVMENRHDLTIETAVVIARDPEEPFYSFTIDKGSVDGIEYLDPVMTADGLVGYISEVSATYSKVITILNVAIDVGAYDSETRDIGIVSGTIDLAAAGMCQMKYLPRDSKVAQGQIILTSGGSLFPRDIVIGKVEEVMPTSHGTSLVATIKPAAQIQTLKNVVVITFFEGSGK